MAKIGNWLIAASMVIAGLSTATPASAQTLDADAVAARVLFVVSGGYWEETVPEAEDTGEEAAYDTGEETAEPQQSETAPEPDEATESEAMAEPLAPARGYYRAVAVRTEDNTSALYLQQIALTEDGPQLRETVDVVEITSLGAYITDLRPENSTGMADRLGFGTYIYLKPDPSVNEPETWSLYVDDFGEIVVEPATN